MPGEDKQGEKKRHPSKLMGQSTRGEGRRQAENNQLITPHSSLFTFSY